MGRLLGRLDLVGVADGRADRGAEGPAVRPAVGDMLGWNEGLPDGDMLG